MAPDCVLISHAQKIIIMLISWIDIESYKIQMDMLGKVCNEMTNPFSNFICCTVEIW